MIQTNAAISNPTATQVARNPSTLTSDGFITSRSGCLIRADRGAGFVPSGRVSGSTSGSPDITGV